MLLSISEFTAPSMEDTVCLYGFGCQGEIRAMELVDASVHAHRFRRSPRRAAASTLEREPGAELELPGTQQVGASGRGLSQCGLSRRVYYRRHACVGVTRAQPGVLRHIG